MGSSTVHLCLDYRPAILGRGGIARATGELARALAARPDVELELFGHSLSPAPAPIHPPERARLHRLPIPGRLLGQLGRLGLGADRLAGRARIAHWTDYVQPHPGRLPVVLTIHDLAFAEDPSWHGATQARELLERTRAAAQAADAVVVPSAATASAMAEHVPGVQPVVVPFGADHVPKPLGPPPLDEPYVLSIGTIEPRKNHLAMLEAWRALPEPRPRWVVLGATGWECDAITAALRRARQEGVLWREGLADAEVFRWLAHARAFAYPSLLEGFGFPPLEALTLGIPTLCGDTPALRELAGDAACFADPRDIEALSEGLRLVCTDDDVRDRLRAAGPKRAADFRWDACAQAHVDVYRGVLAS